MDNKILVVDDEEMIRDLLDETLSEVGFSVYTATTGEEALNLLVKENIEVIFLDLMLPGMDGINLCKLLKKNKPTSCIHAITGYKSTFDLVTCLEAGFDDYFPKPFDLAVITKAAKDSFEKIERWKKI